MTLVHPFLPSPGSRGRAGLFGLVWALAMVAAPVFAEIEVTVRPDGSRWVRNVPASEVPAPKALSVEAALPDGAVPAAFGAEGGEARARYRFASLSAAAPVRLETPVDLERVVAEQAEAHGLDPKLVHAVIRAESAGNRLAVSRVGAMGLMQLMPATAAELAVADPWDETENVRGGAAYLRQMIDRFERLDLALAAYNAGPSAVERHGAVPPYRETVDYVRRVLGTYHGRAVSLAEIRVAPSYVPPPAGERSRSDKTPVLVRDGSGRLHLTNAGPTR